MRVDDDVERAFGWHETFGKEAGNIARWHGGEACVSAVKELFKTFLEIDNLELTSDYYDGEVGIDSGVEVKL